ncbi:MAG: type II secretion system protein N [Sulfuriferula sp.]
MKGYRGAVLAGLICYVVFLTATIPAAFINILLAHYVDKNFQIANVQGTLWQGSGSLYGLEDISWKIRMPELLLGHFHAIINNNAASLPMDVLLSPARIELKHVALTLPAILLSDMGQPLKSMAPGGKLSFSTEDFTVSHTFLGNIDISWRNASSALSQVAPIGSYHFHIAGLGNHLDIYLNTQQGPLFLAGKGAWSPHGGIHFTGTASSKNEQLTALLNLIGKPAENGAYALGIDPHT